jgi:hypothetical protein
MMRRSVRTVAAGAVAILVLVAAGAAFAAEPVQKGVDLWMTVAGRAQTSFAEEPIPAGFFCPGSQPFTGAIAFKGLPLATSPVKGLGKIDTVVRRLDDAVFNDKGEATTRLQLMALSLESVAPVETSCGSFDVKVGLAPGEQPVTTMRIFRSEGLGGTYSAPLALNVKLTFTPLDGDKSARRELTRRVDLGPADNSVWAYVNTARYAPGVKIDTKGDGRPDTLLPAPSNFRPGVSPAVIRDHQTNAVPSPAMMCYIDETCGVGQCPYQSCHCNPNSTNPYEPAGTCDPTHMHCIWTCVPSNCCH